MFTSYWVESFSRISVPFIQTRQIIELKQMFHRPFKFTYTHTHNSMKAIKTTCKNFSTLLFIDLITHVLYLWHMYHLIKQYTANSTSYNDSGTFVIMIPSNKEHLCLNSIIRIHVHVHSGSPLNFCTYISLK